MITLVLSIYVCKILATRHSFNDIRAEYVLWQYHVDYIFIVDNRLNLIVDKALHQIYSILAYLQIAVLSVYSAKFVPHESKSHFGVLGTMVRSVVHAVQCNRTTYFCITAV